MSCLRGDSASTVRRADHLSAAAASNTRMFTRDREFCVHARARRQVCDDTADTRRQTQKPIVSYAHREKNCGANEPNVTFGLHGFSEDLHTEASVDLFLLWAFNDMVWTQ